MFKIAKREGAIEIGFHAARSHTIVDMRECRVYDSGPVRAAGWLRRLLVPILNDGEKADLHVTQTGTGLDLAFRSARKAARL